MIVFLLLVVGQGSGIGDELNAWLAKPPVSKWGLYFRQTSDPTRKTLLGELDKNGKLELGPYALDGAFRDEMGERFQLLTPPKRAARVAELDGWLAAIDEKEKELSTERGKAQRNRDLLVNRYRLAKGRMDPAPMDAAKAKVLSLDNQRAALKILRAETVIARDTCKP